VRFGEVQFSPGAGGIGTPAALLGQQNNPQAGTPQAGTPQSGSGLFNLNFSGSPGQQNQATAAGAMNALGGAGAAGTTAGAGTTGTTATGTTDSSSGTTGTTNSTGQSTGWFGQPSTGAAGQTTAAAPGQTTAGSSGSLFSSPATSAQPGMAGGGAIIGVASLSKANGIHEFNQKAAYKEWLFVYDPGQDRISPTGWPILLRGPYNPNAYFGQAGTPAGATPAGAQGQATPGAPGVGAPGTMGSPGATGMPSPSSNMGPTTAPGGIVPSTQ
jgi:hypothetical protein